jgi:hypothetical protein
MRLMFKLIRNLGSPTRWNLDPYLYWLDSNLSLLPDGLGDAVSDDRFLLRSDRSLWHSQLSRFHFEGRSAEMRFRADGGSREFEFAYQGVLKVLVFGHRFAAAPSLTVHELVPIRGKCIRHAMSFLGGDGVVVYAEKIHFRERAI